MWRLAGAALALVIMGSAGQAIGKTSPARAGVTTLEPSSGGWRPSEDPSDPFTAVNVIGGRSVTADVDPGASLPALPPDIASQTAAADPPKPPLTTRGAAAWLPEPTTWVLLLVGLAMIGFALRGLVAARRRLTKLEKTET